MLVPPALPLFWDRQNLQLPRHRCERLNIDMVGWRSKGLVSLRTWLRLPKARIPRTPKHSWLENIVPLSRASLRRRVKAGFLLHLERRRRHKSLLIPPSRRPKVAQQSLISNRDWFDGVLPQVR